MLACLAALGCSGGADPAPRDAPSEAGAGGECAACPQPSAGEGGGGGTNAPAEGGGAPASGGAASGNSGAPSVDAPVLALRSISLSQTHELPLMAEGHSVPQRARPAPLIAGKRSLFRVFVELEPGWSPRPLLGVLDLRNGSQTSSIVSERSLSESSRQDDVASTFAFDVPPSELTSSTTYRVRVLDQDKTELARFPDEGFGALDAEPAEPFELVMVPLVSAGHAPTLAAPEIAALRARLLAIYPLSDVTISIADSVKLPYVVDGDGNGWDEALDDLYAYRDAASPADNVFFYGMLAPSTSFTSYCKSSCVLGYSVIAEADDVASRGSIGVTIFADGSGASDAWDTLAHELGHALGRDHANCGLELGEPADPDDYDADYPYLNAGMGSVYGFDFATMRLVKPKTYRDVMSYCVPVWISDYTYRAIDERLDYIASSRFRALSLTPPAMERVARIRRDGQTRWLTERERRGSGATRAVALLDAAGVEVGQVMVRFSPIDHAAGGYVSLSAASLAVAGAVSLDLRPLGGSILPL